jgi:hypothetical protein
MIVFSNTFELCCLLHANCHWCAKYYDTHLFSYISRVVAWRFAVGVHRTYWPRVM